MGKIARRDFLKAASAAAAAAPLVVPAAGAARGAARTDVKIGDASYTPVPEYPSSPSSIPRSR